MESVQKYLEEQSHDGSFESEGGFTLSLDRAQELVKYRLPRPYAWVSLLVQSAVRWKCSEMAIVQSRYTTRFLFPLQPAALSELEKRLLTSDPCEEKLLLALSYLVAKWSNGYSFSVTGADGTTRRLLANGKLNLTERDRTPPAGSLVLEVSHWRPPNSEEVFPVLTARRERLEIYTELQNHCAACPVPITVDTRPIQAESFFYRNRSKGRRMPLNLEILPALEPRIALAAPHALRLILNGSIPEKVGGVVSVTLDLPEQRIIPNLTDSSQIVWIQDGVAVDQSPLPFSTRLLSLTVFACADGLKTDLSGFQLLEGDELSERTQQVLSALFEALREGRKLDADRVGAAGSGVYQEPKYPGLTVVGGLLGGIASGLGLIAAVGGAVAMLCGVAAGSIVAGGVATIASFVGLCKVPYLYQDDKEFLAKCAGAAEKDLQRVIDSLQ